MKEASRKRLPTAQTPAISLRLPPPPGRILRVFYYVRCRTESLLVSVHTCSARAERDPAATRPAILDVQLRRSA